MFQPQSSRDTTAMTDRQPLVSMVTPVLNGRRYVDECVRSVLEQDYPHLEHVFVDGGSSDGTFEVLSDYESAHPGRIRIIVERGSSAGQAWNTALKATRGTILGGIGVDDLCEAGAISAVVEYFVRHPDADFLHGDCLFLDDDAQVRWHHRAVPFAYQQFADTALHIATTSAYFRRHVMERIGWLDQSGDDFDVMLRIARDFAVHPLPVVLSRLRVRRDSALNPASFDKRLQAYRQTYLVSRRYGGRRWSPIARRYWVAELMGHLHLAPLLPLVRRGYRTLRGRAGA